MLGGAKFEIPGLKPGLDFKIEPADLAGEFWEVCGSGPDRKTFSESFKTAIDSFHSAPLGVSFQEWLKGKSGSDKCPGGPRGGSKVTVEATQSVPATATTQNQSQYISVDTTPSNVMMNSGGDYLSDLAPTSSDPFKDYSLKPRQQSIRPQPVAQPPVGVRIPTPASSRISTEAWMAIGAVALVGAVLLSRNASTASKGAQVFLAAAKAL